MNIQEVSDILGVCWPLRMPKYVLITDEGISQQHNGQTFFRGLQPKSRGDIVVLGVDANITTVPHESWHAMTGFGELTAHPIGNLFARRYERLKQFPRLKDALTRRVQYREVDSASEFPNFSKYQGRAKLYTVVKG